MRHIQSVMIALALVVWGTLLVEVTHANYNGSGYFPTANLRRCAVGTQSDAGGSYTTPAQNASATWSSATDLNMSYNCSDYQISTSAANYGTTNWDGFALICMNGPSGLICHHGAGTYDYPYASCDARLNTARTGGLDQTTRRFIYTHELGHCYSLYHRNENDSVMVSPGVIGSLPLNPNDTDVSLINARY